MKVLLLGYSNIARRRVIPGLYAAGVRAIDIASLSATTVEWPGTDPPRLYRDYEKAISETDAQLIYISTVNSLHAELGRKALNHGFHVVIDKPACLGLTETREIVDLARHKHLCVAEATVYGYHPRMEIALQAFQEANVKPTRLIQAFSFPPPRKENFRHNAALGGGAMWDLGPYAITPWRLFFGAAPDEVVGRCFLSIGSDVDTGFSVLARFSGGRAAVGHFGYTTEYFNRLDIIGPGVAVTMDRAFSPLPDRPSEITIRRADHTITTSVPLADTFARFFAEVFQAIDQADYARFGDTMLADSREMDRLRSSAQQGPIPI